MHPLGRMGVASEPGLAEEMAKCPGVRIKTVAALQPAEHVGSVLLVTQQLLVAQPKLLSEVL